jgi:hypothetical protein
MWIESYAIYCRATSLSGCLAGNLSCETGRKERKSELGALGSCR